MRFLIFIPPKEFRDESVALIKLFFDKWGVDYKISTYSSSDCVGTHGAVYKPDIHASKISVGDFDGVVLIDGAGVDGYKLFDYRPLLDIMLRFNQDNKFIIAISNSVKIPARANIVKDKRVAVDDSETKRLVVLFHGIPTQKEFEMSGNLITISNPKDIEESMQRILEHMGVA